MGWVNKKFDPLSSQAYYFPKSKIFVENDTLDP
jgi:hypothetical protein